MLHRPGRRALNGAQDASHEGTATPVRNARPAAPRATDGSPRCCCAPTAGASPFAYITNQGSHDVSVIDLASQQVVATVPVGRSPAGVVASSRAGKVFVSNPDSKTHLGHRHAHAAGRGHAPGRRRPGGHRRLARRHAPVRGRLVRRPAAGVRRRAARAPPRPRSRSAARRPAWRRTPTARPSTWPSATTTASPWSTSPTRRVRARVEGRQPPLRAALRRARASGSMRSTCRATMSR